MVLCHVIKSKSTDTFLHVDAFHSGWCKLKSEIDLGLSSMLEIGMVCGQVRWALRRSNLIVKKGIEFE